MFYSIIQKSYNKRKKKMKIKFNLDCIKPMIDWLLESKKNNVRDENKLREILNMPDYKIEFARYGSPYIPVCGINLEEAVDFFLNFDKKDFKNERLQYKKESFLAFYNEIEKQLKKNKYDHINFRT